MTQRTAFFAYPSYPNNLTEVLRSAIKKINQAEPQIKITSWEDLNVTGNLIVSQILTAISQADVFACDLTYLNPNVLFELGFAIARRKKVWIVIDTNIKDSQEKFNKFKILTTSGYSPYSNSQDILNSFIAEKPFDNLEKTLFKDAIEQSVEQLASPKMLFLKSGINTEASTKLSQIVESSEIPVTIDDPQEMQIQSLSWYAQHTYNAPAVIAHFLSTNHINHGLHNAKCAFISGLALGFESDILMLAHEPFKNAPIDYKDMLFVHNTAAACEETAENWLGKQKSNNFASFLRTAQSNKPTSSYTDLQRIALGEFVAENERESLKNYFVQTAAFNNALRENHTVFIGRKGTGKTANFFMLHDTLLEDKRNHVCLIKPPSYELEGVLRILRQAISTSEQGYLIESLWKFLIYSELVVSIMDKIKQKPKYLAPDSNEQNFLDFVEQSKSVFKDEFSIRLDNSVKALQEVESLGTAAQQRARISELLHMDIIGKARSYVGNVLSEKNKVVILIDNLDKAWKKGANLKELSTFLFGLISVSQDVAKEFNRQNPRREPVNLSIAVFLRSDIFQQISRYAREPDKISFQQIDWNDQELLTRVIEERILTSNISADTNDVWSKYFCDIVRGVPTKDYILQAILPRPRDLVFFVRYALTSAVNRGHSVIEESDILTAEGECSYHALESLVVEASPILERVEDLLYQFAGGAEIVNGYDLSVQMEKVSIPIEEQTEYLDALIGMSFFGVETKNGEFTFIYSEKDHKKALAMASKLNESPEKMRYKINKPFTAFLELSV